MSARLGKVLCVVALVASAPVSAAELWDCTYKSMPVGVSGRIEIQIDGKAMVWGSSVGDIKPVLRNVRYQVLENNDVGLVAATSTALFPSKSLGPMVGGAMITLNKSNGELRFVDTADTDHRIVGACKVNSAAP